MKWSDSDSEISGLVQCTTEAGKRLKRFGNQRGRAEPQAVQSILRDFADCLTYDDPVRTRFKKSNTLKRYLREIERCTVPRNSTYIG